MYIVGACKIITCKSGCRAFFLWLTRCDGVGTSQKFQSFLRRCQSVHLHVWRLFGAIYETMKLRRQC